MNSAKVFTLLCHAGFSVAETGGGCTAWIKEYPHASVLITGDCGCTHNLAPENIEGGVLIGIVTEEGEPVRNYKAGTLDDLPSALLQCIGIAERFSPEVFYSERTAFSKPKTIECF